jgi:hypothetical protein
MYFIWKKTFSILNQLNIKHEIKIKIRINIEKKFGEYIN